jgi:signal transduction histidine kinase
VLHGVALTAVAALVIAAGAAGDGLRPGLVLSSDAGAVVALLVGITRRQARVAERRERELQERALASEREAARSRLLAERTAVARDIHDVLAHSLGGLVIQLDAVAALLESGRTEEASGRVEQARRLAGDGLADARRAVAALRDPDAAAPPPAAEPTMEDFIATHHSLGAAVEVEGDLALDGLDPAHRDALVRAVQEALSNARRHAPGATTRLRMDRLADGRAFRIATPLTSAPASPGGGHGLTGMRERFAALGDGSTVTAGPVGGEFVVEGRLAG